MILHTPRRRISPRTRRRYRVIREFFRRALGSSQPDIKINSSIAINVTDLKRKIVGLEHQLDEVNKQCRDYSYLDCNSRNVSCVSFDHLNYKRAIETINEQAEPSTKSKQRENDVETNIIYKSDYDREISVENVLSNLQDKNTSQKVMSKERKPKVNKSKLFRIQEDDSKLYNHKAKSVHDNFSSAYSTSSFRSLAIPIPEAIDEEFQNHHKKARYSKVDNIGSNAREKKHRDHSKSRKKYHYEYETQTKKNKQAKEFDTDFITDIIRRQYKPLQIIGRRTSEISQFSAPVCRDQEFTVYDDTREDTDFCSCCCDGRMGSKPIGNMKSVCDTRLYSSKRYFPRKQRRLNECHHNPDLYDLVPVKEKSSPQARRKFFEDNMMPHYEHHLEVPPSPRSNRPRLNLKAHFHTECDDQLCYEKHERRSVFPISKPNEYETYVTETIESDTTSVTNEKQPKPARKRVVLQSANQQQVHPDFGISPHGLTINDVQINTQTDKTLRTEDSGSSAVKTDKALSEIKDILQSFLQEIKKEATEQCDKTDNNNSNIGENVVPDNNAKSNTNNSPNCPLGQFHPYLPPPPFLNACNYSILPVCSLNYPMQTNFMKPNPSYICMNCVNDTEPQCEKCHKNVDTSESHNPETEELIKEIHKLIAEGTIKKGFNDQQRSQKYDKDNITHTTARSIGRQSLRSRHDAKVGTQPLLCHSKSCEAIRTKSLDTLTSNGYLNPCYSDTVLDKLSLDVSRSTMKTQLEIVPQRKEKPSKFLKVLSSFGIFKKKKKDQIEELESGSTVDVDIPRNIYNEVPHKQDITNYVMHGQEFYHPFPVDEYHHEPHEYRPEYVQPYNSEIPGYHMQHHPAATQCCPYEGPCDTQLPPQPHGPLCLKEIEVRSMSTQSERKLSIFDKIKLKLMPGVQNRESNDCKHCSTQTMQTPTPPPTSKPLFSWLLGKQDLHSDPRMGFQLGKQQEHLEIDKRIRKGLMKNLFIKKKTFAPKSLMLSAMVHNQMYRAAGNVLNQPRLFY